MLQSLLGVDAISDLSNTLKVLEYGYEIGLDWLGKFAKAIIEGIGIIGLGIVVFTIVLKAIVLPFDIYQRVSMRKQNLIMKEMQPELEKLQKQYANDKTTYNQKMMELYKKNGYSMLGACLPMIFSLVILIVAFQGFRTYSQYANLAMYEKMSQAYSEQVLQFAPDMKDFGKGRTYFVLTKEGEAENLLEGKIAWADDSLEERVIKGSEVGLTDETTFRLLAREKAEDHKNVEVSSSKEDKFIFCTYWIEEKNVSYSYYPDTVRLSTYLEKYGDKPFDDTIPAEEAEGKLTKNEVYQEIYKAAEEKEKDQEDFEVKVANRYIQKIGAMWAAKWYRDGHDAHFLWVKNVWYPDVSYNHPIQSYDKFKGQLNAKVTLKDGAKVSLSSVLGQGEYEALVSELKPEQKQANGYFILIILSIGFMVLSQFISMRSSKESNKYQTVDGQGAKTQKMMLFIMPLIYAVFAFLYSAAFSIYMVMSSVISLLTTVFANLIIGRVFKKKEQNRAKESVTRKYAWQMTEKEKRAKEKEAKKEAKMQERANRFKNRK